MDQLAENSQVDLSIEEERKVARTFMGRIEWEMIVIGLGQFIVWFVTWSLVVNNLIPLWAGFVITTISTACAYLPSHAGQHGHLSGKHKHLKWLNTVVGQISLIPLAQSHHILKATHMKHHAHTNDPKKDPDYRHTHVDNWLQSAIQIQNQTGEGGLIEVVEKLSKEDSKFAKALETGGLVGFLFFFAQMAVAVIYPLETLLLWWIPRKLAVSYLGIIFSSPVIRATFSIPTLFIHLSKISLASNLRGKPIIPLSYFSIVSAAKCVLPVLVGPKTAVILFKLVSINCV